jgi:hypothetical protein
MIEKNTRPQLQEDPKPPLQKTGKETNKSSGDPKTNIHDEQTSDVNQREQENAERSGEKLSGPGEETLGIP